MAERLRPDRRRQPRGGRRPTDRGGYTPMIVVIEEDSRQRDIAEAILAKLRFAVAPFESADQAISAMRAPAPPSRVAREDVAASIRGAQRSRRSRSDSSGWSPTPRSAR